MEVINIHNKIFEIRGQRVMLDFDLAALYDVETKAINQAVKRNIERFPEDFMFRITEEEWMRSQTVTASEEGDIHIQTFDNQNIKNGMSIVSNTGQGGMRSQIVIVSGQKRNKSHLPYAFTEHGVTMLASVLRSEKAVKMSIAVVRAFISLKDYVIKQDVVTQQLQELRDRLGEHDVQLNSIYDAIENLLDEKEEKKNWQDRPRIGFKH